MSKDIISKKTRREFREYMVSWPLRRIEEEFDSADVPMDNAYNPPTSGSRRSLIEKYYHRVDWTKWDDVRKVLAVFQHILTTLENDFKVTDSLGSDPMAKTFDSIIENLRLNALHTFDSLKKWLEQDGFEYTGCRLVAVGRDVQLRALSTTTANLDAPELHRQIQRMYDSIEDDPALAIGTAKELVETACKTILAERDVSIDSTCDLGELVKETRKVLGLLPEDIPEAAKGAETVRRLLGSLGTIAQGLGELRNLYGTGHGKHGKARGLRQRHARLAAGAASTLVTFLFEAHLEGQNRRA